MIPQFCRVRHEPENETYGDCLRACVASLLDLEPDAVPHFFHDNCEGAEGFRRLTEYLDGRGLAPICFSFAGVPIAEFLASTIVAIPNSHFLLLGVTENGGEHVVVCHQGKVVHDPAWVRSPMTSPINGEVWQVMVIGIK